MNTPTQPPARRPRSQARHTMDFRESLAPYMPATQPLPALGSQALSPGAMRVLMYSLWVLAAVAAGAGIGLYIIAQRPAGQTVSALPVANAAVAVGSTVAAASTDLSRVSAPAAGTLVVSPAFDIYQSQTGNVWRVVPAAVYQAAAQPEALQPGFTGYGFGQGGNGTDPVIIR